MATPPKASARQRNPRGSGEKLRDDLLTAAEALLDETGDPGRVTVRGVAASVGVAPNAVYLHFAKRDDLLVATVVRRFGSFVDTLHEQARTIADPRELLIAAHRAYMAFAKANPGVYRAMFGGQSLDPTNVELGDRLVEAALPAFLQLLDNVDRARTAGVLPAGISRSAFARLLFAAEHGWTDLSGTSRGAILPEADDILETLLALGGEDQEPATPAT